MSRARTNEALVLSGLTELAAGALTGWPYALAMSVSAGPLSLA